MKSDDSQTHASSLNVNQIWLISLQTLEFLIDCIFSLLVISVHLENIHFIMKNYLVYSLSLSFLEHSLKIRYVLRRYVLQGLKSSCSRTDSAELDLES